VSDGSGRRPDNITQVFDGRGRGADNTTQV